MSVSKCPLPPSGHLNETKEISLPEWELVGVASSGDRLPPIPVDERPLRIGRRENSDYVITDPTVSLDHAEIFSVGSKIFLRDLNSTNGTFVNGQRIQSLTLLNEGDQIYLGCIAIQVCIKKPRDKNVSTRADATVVSFDGWIDDKFHQLTDRGGLHIVYHPIVKSSSGETIGYEALTRSRVPGLESPIELFRLASRRKLATQLSQICRMLAITQAGPFPDGVAMFLNTDSAETLDDNLIKSLEEVRKACDRFRIVVELHEECFVDPFRLGVFQHELNQLGIEMAFDDFGAGQSRLQDLLHVQPDYVKFDRSLLEESQLKDRKKRSWVQSLVHSVRDLGIQTIAEGVENHEHFKRCRGMGFDYCQGFAFGKPAPAAEW